MNQPDINLLAREFARTLRDTLDDSEIRLVNERNATAFPGVCHSHDFRDANMVMLAAWEKLTGAEPDLDSCDYADAWNAAWDMARIARFYVDDGALLAAAEAKAAPRRFTGEPPSGFGGLQ